MPFEAAAQMEKDFAEDLRRAGYTVTGGHQPITVAQSEGGFRAIGGIC
jgi:hypothetical protein